MSEEWSAVSETPEKMAQVGIRSKCLSLGKIVKDATHASYR